MIVTDDYRTLVFRPKDIMVATMVAGEVEKKKVPYIGSGKVVAINNSTEKCYIVYLIYNKEIYHGEEGLEQCEINESLFFADKKKAEHLLDRINKNLSK